MKIKCPRCGSTKILIADHVKLYACTNCNCIFNETKQTVGQKNVEMPVGTRKRQNKDK